MLVRIIEWINSNKIRTGLLIFDLLLFALAIIFYHLGMLPIVKTGDLIFWLVLIFAFALYRPGWAFLFFVGAVVLENISLTAPEMGITLRIYQVLGALVIIALAVRKALNKAGLNLFRLKMPDYLILLFLAGSLISSLFSAQKAASLKITLIIFSFTALYFLTRAYIQDQIDLKKIIPFFLASSLGVVIYGILQNIFFIQGWAFHGEVMPGRPNATFMEPDWLGIYLVFLLAVIYALIYYFNKERNDRSSLIFNDQIPISKQIPNPKISLEIKKIQSANWRTKFKITIQNLKLFLAYFYLIFIYILLILTVSRSAWLGAGFITLVFLKAILTEFSWHFSNWRWKIFLHQAAWIALVGTISMIIVHTFNLTSFQLFDRAQSTGTGLQKITISCKNRGLSPQNGDLVPTIDFPEKINSSEELIRYGCRHINLEEIKMEEGQGNLIKEVYRPDPNVDIRSQIYQESWEIIKKHPILGIGFGSIALYLGQDGRGENLNSSNIFLEVWLGSGLIGLLVFIFIWINALIVFGKGFWLAKSAEERAFALFVLLGFFALLIPNLFNAGILLMILWFFWGIIPIRFNEK